MSFLGRNPTPCYVVDCKQFGFYLSVGKDTQKFIKKMHKTLFFSILCIIMFFNIKIRTVTRIYQRAANMTGAAASRYAIRPASESSKA